MRCPFFRWLTGFLTVAILTAAPGHADPPVPANLLAPQTAAEAWNVIRLPTKNVARLMEENRMEEIPAQISLCSPSLRALPPLVATPEAAAAALALTRQVFPSINAIALAAQQKNPPGVSAA